MQQGNVTNFDQRVKRIATSLKKDFAPEIAENPSGFKSRLIGKLRVFLPRKRPGRKGSPEVRQAAEIYERDFKAQGEDGNWHSIAKNVFPDYVELTSEIQRLRRIGLRANVHSFLYDERSRLKRKTVRVENIES
jgi:hypothetical protein